MTTVSTRAMADTIGLCLAGQISPHVAIARLLLNGASPATLAATLDARAPDDPAAHDAWSSLHRLIAERPEALSRLATEIATMHTDRPAPSPCPTDDVAAFFDRAVAFSPEASVALYSLGDPAVLAQATAEIMLWLDDHGCLGDRSDVLDLGCGIGRVSEALAGRAASVLGLDVSTGMVAAARRRCAGLVNVRIELTAGLTLDALADRAFDLVLAVDSFPYLVQGGPTLVAAHLDGAGRILRSGGHLVILNLSYGRDLATDRADAAAWAAAYGFELLVDGARPFTLWDGSAFLFRRWEQQDG